MTTSYRVVLPDTFLKLHVGHVAGDLLKVDMAKLTDSEVLLSGPPCTPWAPNGLKKGTLDERADVYERVSDWILELAYRGVLVISLLENGAKQP